MVRRSAGGGSIREGGREGAGSPFTFSFGTNIMHDGPRHAAHVAAAGGEKVLPPQEEAASFESRRESGGREELQLIK